MSFWAENAAREERIARDEERAAAITRNARIVGWLDVTPALCAYCAEVKRGVLLGVCESCMEERL